MPNSEAVTDQNRGAWVIKCNPAKWDLPGFIASGRTIDSWSVQENYRSKMMEHGQRVLFWVTGPTGGAIDRGFWGSGWTTGPVMDAAYGTDDFWLDEDAASRVRLFAPMELTLWNKPVTESELVAVGLDQIEVIRSRQGANPSWLSIEELDLLEPLLPAWPTAAPEQGA